MASSSSGSGAPALLGDPFASYSKIFSPTANASLAWRTPKPNSTEGLTAFLDNNPPSKTKSCGQERQIWLINSYKRPETPSAQAGVAARNAIRDIHRDYVELLTACQEINDNEKIPVRANKKQGRSKKTRRDELIVEFEEMMPQVARDNGLSTGRLVLFIERGIDVIVKDLAYSMVKGALSRLPTAKVHAIEVDCVDLKSAGREWQVVSIYFDSIWNRVAAEEVGKALLSQHGQPSGLATSAVHAMLDIINRKNPLSLTPLIYEIAHWVTEEDQQEIVKKWQAAKPERDIQRIDWEREEMERDASEDSVTESETESESETVAKAKAVKSQGDDKKAGSSSSVSTGRASSSVAGAYTHPAAAASGAATAAPSVTPAKRPLT